LGVSQKPPLYDQSLLLVRNLLIQGEAPDEVAFWFEEVSRVMANVLQALREGEIN